MPTIIKLSDESDASCPCCDEPAFPYTVAGADGYVDACPEHAEDNLIEAGLLSEPAPVSVQGEGPAFPCWTDKLAEDEPTNPY